MIVSCVPFTYAAVGKVEEISASKATPNSVTVNWSSVSSVRGYSLYRYSYSAKKWSTIKNTSALSYKDNSVKPGERYAYKVRAYVASGGKIVYGAYSDNAYVNTPPEQVTSVSTYNVSSDSITLQWKAAEGATGYAVYSYDSQSKKYTNLGTTAKTSLTFKFGEEKFNAKFRVRAYAKIGSSYVYGALSAIYTNKIVLSNVENVKLSNVTQNSYKLSWNSVSGAQGYQIAKYNSKTGKWIYIKNVSGNSYTISGLAAGSSDIYRIRAYVMKNGSYVFSNFTSSFTAVTLPSAPKNLSVTANNYKGLTLKWSAVKGATGYLIYTYNAAKGTWKLLGTTTKNYYFNNNLTETRDYTYKVRAFTRLNGVNYYGEFCPSASGFYKVQVQTNETILALEKQGIFGYLYDPAEVCFYTASDPWQRNIGYNEVFDFCAPFTLINFDTQRIYFKYKNQDWLVQLWKGQYGLLFYGAEVGVYNKPSNRDVDHFDCVTDSDLLKMSMDFYVKSSTGKWNKKFTRPYGEYWWCTGFLAGNIGMNFDRLCFNLRITMKDSEMLSSFIKGLGNTELSYKVDGLDVYIFYA